nr:SDR family oxidoreductase [uncultured Rhodoferax sp.]
MRVLILGATGMLGNAMFRLLSESRNLTVYGTARLESSKHFFPNKLADNIITGLDAENYDSLVGVFDAVHPDVVVNCIGLVKQLAGANTPLHAISINALLPHRVATLCQIVGARLVHFSTDCVFSGKKGNYLESDFPDTNDLYGRSKLLGEVDYPHAITLRTSIIGHELSGHRSLIGWFLAQEGKVNGYARAIFSGLPTVELAHVVRDFILPYPQLCGLYHVGSKPINKFELLKLVARVYGRNIDVIPSNELIIDRSLNTRRFEEATGYIPTEWLALVQHMYAFK